MPSAPQCEPEGAWQSQSGSNIREMLKEDEVRGREGGRGGGK